MNSEENKILVDLARLTPTSENLEGEVDCVDFEREFIHPFGGIRYNLRAQLFGTELLVRGHLEQDFTLACSRCGEDFDTTIYVDDFMVSREIGSTDEFVDLTDEARECIILALPNFPLCAEDCPGIYQETKTPVDDRWKALDDLNGV